MKIIESFFQRFSFFVFAAVCLFPMIASGQTYYDSNAKKVSNIKKASYYIDYAWESDSEKNYKKLFYNTDKVLIGEYNCFKQIHNSIELEVYHGTCKEWYPSGNIKSVRNYTNGLMDGLYQEFSDNGEIIKECTYKDGSINLGSDECANISKSFSDMMSKKVVSEDNKTIVREVSPNNMPNIVPASFPGGDAAFKAFLRDNINFPLWTKIHQVRGRILVSFTVQKDGRVVVCKASNVIDPYSEAEIMRVISMSPIWTPATINGEPIDYPMTIPVVVGS